MNYKAVLWDMDGVLIDSEPGYYRSNSELFHSLGLPYGNKEASAVTGSTAYVIADKILSWYPDLSMTRDQLASTYLDGIIKALHQYVNELIPGVSDWVHTLREYHILQAIGSSSTKDMVMYVSDRFDLTRNMDTIITGEMVKRGKPYPDIYNMCCEQLHVKPSECLVIEDSRNGILSAHAAGCACAAFTGTNRYNIDLSEADLFFNAYSAPAFQQIFEKELIISGD